jgi:hypothetical protein
MNRRLIYWALTIVGLLVIYTMGLLAGLEWSR